MKQLDCLVSANSSWRQYQFMSQGYRYKVDRYWKWKCKNMTEDEQSMIPEACENEGRAVLKRFITIHGSSSLENNMNVIFTSTSRCHDYCINNLHEQSKFANKHPNIGTMEGIFCAYESRFMHLPVI